MQSRKDKVVEIHCQATGVTAQHWLSLIMLGDTINLIVLGMVFVVQVEQGTPFERWYAGQDSPLPKEPEAVAMFEAAVSTLTAAGYQHYEVGSAGHTLPCMHECMHECHATLCHAMPHQ